MFQQIPIPSCSSLLGSHCHACLGRYTLMQNRYIRFERKLIHRIYTKVRSIHTSFYNFFVNFGCQYMSVLKQVHPDTGISNKTMAILLSMSVLKQHPDTGISNKTMAILLISGGEVNFMSFFVFVVFFVLYLIHLFFYLTCRGRSFTAGASICSLSNSLFTQRNPLSPLRNTIC